MQSKLINWFQLKHSSYQGANQPLLEASQQALQKLCDNILIPLQKQFGEITITYGFTSFQLLNYIKKNSPDHKRYLHVKHRDEQGKQNVGRGASGIKALSLLQQLI